MADIEEKKVVESKRGRKRKAKTESRKQHEVSMFCRLIMAPQYPSLSKGLA